MLSVIIPVYNEGESTSEVVTKLKCALESEKIPHEILVVNDGSTDNTGGVLSAVANEREVVVLEHDRNRGYGAALKTGMRKAKGEWIGIVDADGTYPVEEIVDLLRIANKRNCDMVVGARTGRGASFPLLRRPGKLIVQLLAAFLTGRTIPDLNSGMRVFRRELATRYMHLFPQGFSFTTTITLAALTNDYVVRFRPINYYPRKGRSSMGFWGGLTREFPNFLILIVRIVTYFKPLRFFALPSMTFFVVGVINLGRTLRFEQNITDASILLIVVGVQIGLMGLIADLIVKSRR